MSGRETSRGWGAVVGLALLAAALSVVHPALLMFLPLALMLLALPPRRLPLIVLGMVLVAVAVIGPREDVLWYAERGWAMLLGAWFIVMVVALPRASFMSRGLAATGAAVASAALVFLANPRGWQSLNWTVGRRLRDGAADVATVWNAQRTTTAAADSAGFQQQVSEAIYRAADLQAELYPSLLALASLASLAVGWWMFRRLADREARPLGRLREFRFRDELVWMLIAALFLLVLPLGGSGRWWGSNVLTFMLALYGVRGAAVILTLATGRGPMTLFLGALALIFLYPLVMAATLLVGVSDTWLDLRSRTQRAA